MIFPEGELEQLYKELTEKEYDNQEVFDRIKSIFDLCHEHLEENWQTTEIWLKKIYDLAVKFSIPIYQAKTKHNLGILQFRHYHLAEALELFKDTLFLYEQLKDLTNMGLIYNNIAIVYMNLANYDLALSYLQKAIRIHKKLNDTLNLNNNYLNLAIIYKRMNKDKKALDCYLKQIQLSREMNDNIVLSKCLNNVAIIYKKRKKYDIAASCLKESVKLHKQLNSLEGLVSNYLLLGGIFYVQNKPKQAFQYVHRSRKIAQRLNFRKALLEIYNSLLVLFEDSKDYKKALHYMKKYTDLKVDLLSENQDKKLTDLITEIEKRELEKNAVFSMAVTASHEINQPLMVLQANMEMMFIKLENIEDEIKISKYITKITESINDIKKILNKFSSSEHYSLTDYVADVEMVNLK